MNSNIQAWLNTPIPRKQVLSGISLMLVGQAMREWGIRMQAKLELKDAEERCNILKETSLFLLDRADNATHAELNKHLDFWRTVRGIPVAVEAEKNKTSTWFESEFGYNVEMAKSWLTDMYKAPEARAAAQEFLDAVERLEDK